MPQLVSNFLGHVHCSFWDFFYTFKLRTSYFVPTNIVLQKFVGGDFDDQ